MCFRLPQSGTRKASSISIGEKSSMFLSLNLLEGFLEKVGGILPFTWESFIICFSVRPLKYQKIWYRALFLRIGKHKSRYLVINLHIMGSQRTSSDLKLSKVFSISYQNFVWKCTETGYKNGNFWWLIYCRMIRYQIPNHKFMLQNLFCTDKGYLYFLPHPFGIVWWTVKIIPNFTIVLISKLLNEKQ